MREEEETFSRASRALESEITAPLNRNRNLVKLPDLKMKDLPNFPSLTNLSNLPDRYDLTHLQTSDSMEVEETVITSR